MSDNDTAKLLSRIAALEAGSTNRPAGIDPQRLQADPIGVLAGAGINVDYLTQVLVARAMGDKAPPELRVLAQMGPTVSAAQSAASEVQVLRQRLEQLESRSKQDTLRQGFSALANDKTKYPTLAAAYARNPGLFDSAVATHQGDAAALAEAEETRLKTLAAALGHTPPASTGNADTASGQSTQTTAQQGASSTGIDPTPPPLPSTTKPAGVLTQDAAAALKAKIVAKFGPKINAEAQA